MSQWNSILHKRSTKISKCPWSNPMERNKEKSIINYKEDDSNKATKSIWSQGDNQIFLNRLYELPQPKESSFSSTIPRELYLHPLSLSPPSVVIV